MGNFSTPLAAARKGGYCKGRCERGNPLSFGQNPLSKSKPIIGLAGGIGSGKSTVARVMAGEGGLVIDADALAHESLRRSDVTGQIREWWGPGVLDERGEPDRAALARIIFDDPAQRRRLEGLIHPLVAQRREQMIEAARSDPSVRFIVLDVPLLMEVGLDRECDRVVFVEADEQTRLDRVKRQRGWDREELTRRQSQQMTLDRKRSLAHDIIRNDQGEGATLAQVRELLGRLLGS